MGFIGDLEHKMQFEILLLIFGYLNHVVDFLLDFNEFFTFYLQLNDWVSYLRILYTTYGFRIDIGLLLLNVDHCYFRNF